MSDFIDPTSGGMESSSETTPTSKVQAEVTGLYARNKRAAEEGPITDIIITPNGVGTVQRGEGGRIFLDLAQPQSQDLAFNARVAALYDPWDVVITPTGTNSYTYRLIPSTVNGVAPNNFTTVFSGNKSSAKYINLSISATNGRITSVVISPGGAPVDAPPVLQSIPPSSFTLQIGVIGTDGIYYKFVAPKPFVASPTVSFEADRTTPIPGLSPRIQWWTWVITQP